jgi:hypothetical protein
MKKIVTVIAIALVTSACMLTSCGKSSGSSSGGGTITFTSNGTNYTYSCPTGLIGHSAGNELQFVSTDPNNSSNDLNFVGGSNASGTYSFGPTTNLSFLINGKSYSGQNPNTGNYTGSITVNISGSTATATFSTVLYNALSLTDSVIITNGKYTGKYLVEPY